MRITVLGSTGRTGRLVVADAIRRGHLVTAFTRRPDTMPDTLSPESVVAGDGRDPQAVRSALAGADAVIAVVAAATRKGPHHTAEVARVVTAAMADTGVRRVAFTSAYPIVSDRPRVPVAILRRMLADAYADTARMERVLAATDLDWTVVRLNRLLDKPARGNVQISRDLLDRPRSITRADAAATLVDTVETGTYARSAINIAGR